MEEDKKQEIEEKTYDKVSEQVDEKIKKLAEQGVQQTNVDYLGKLIDIKKDIKEMEEQDMMYRGNYRGEYGNYDNYSGGRSRDSMGRYTESGNYGRRGYDNKYRGHEIMDDMYRGYQEYQDGKEMYGADTKTLESFKYMVKSFKDYYKHLKQNASSQEEVRILDEAIDEMARM